MRVRTRSFVISAASVLLVSFAEPSLAGTVTFSHTGSEQMFIVPAGVTAVEVRDKGACN